MRFFDTRSDSPVQLQKVFDARLEGAQTEAESAVRAILADVQTRGDAAVLEYTRRWSYSEAFRLRVSEKEIADAARRVQATPLWDVMQTAAARIQRFHEQQKRASWMDVSTPGETLGQIVRPLARVGVYAPGGTASYPSTVLMTCVPARVAGVPSVALATPPGSNGLPPDATLAAAFIAGVSEVYAMGGAQAIGALAYGTESVVRVHKILGPGNLYVNLAKRHVFGIVGIDSLAGPSEIAVLADEDADPQTAAADVLSQCEHDANGSALVATHSARFAQGFLAALETQLATLDRRDIAAKALASNGFLVQTQSQEDSARVVSQYAPEHLHLVVRDPWALLPQIENAGAVLIGPYTSAPLGDYVAGPSHTLPTAGCARFASPLGVDDFVKRSSILAFGRNAAEKLSPLAATFADAEGLDAHARAARHTLRSE